MEYTNAGAEFVFGETYADHFFAFKVKPNPFSKYYFLVSTFSIFVDVPIETDPKPDIHLLGMSYVDSTSPPFSIFIISSEVSGLQMFYFVTIALKETSRESQKSTNTFEKAYSIA